MDFQRLILIAALSVTLLMIWQAWQEDYGPKPPQEVAETAPGAPRPQDLPAGPAISQPSDTPAVQGMRSAQRVRVVTDVIEAEIDTAGGDLRRVALPQYPVSVDTPENPFVLMEDKASQVYIAQSGLRPAAGSTLPVPDHHTIYQAQQTEYSLEPGQDQVEVRLTWDSEGVEAAKIFTFKRGSYVVDVRYEVRNGGDAPWQAYLYRQLQRTPPPKKSKMFIYTYTGGVIYSKEEKYEKISFDDMEDNALHRDITGGWAAMIEHYFLSAWIPPVEEKNKYYTIHPEGSDRYIIGMLSQQALSVAPGETGSVASRLYVGPKLQDYLAEVATGLELTVDYGVLTVIAKPLFWLLEHIHSLVGNWGWAIIILTLLIKLAFFKLSATSYKSMAHMRKMQPRMAALKERYGDDRQKFQEAMMKMYKEEKINPLSGCLPILVQIPVFIALYWTLLESVEMRQAPFILWINDLSSADPYFVLPILMGLTMLIQHRLNPSPMDPIQARVMMILPIVFTVFFAFFPAGLVLYWVVNNTLSIAQQWYITRHVVQA